MTVEADLTQAKIDNLMPGWVKPAGKSGRATFTVINKDKATRFEDLVIDGAGALVKGSAEIDSSGDLVSANFPVFALSDGDKTSLKADRANDGTLRLAMRGEVYDGRNFVKSVSTVTQRRIRSPRKDIDIDVKLGAVAGHNGEALRGLDLPAARGAASGPSPSIPRSAATRRFPANCAARRVGRQVLFSKPTTPARSFALPTTTRGCRGQMWVAIDPPTADQQPQDGLLNIRDFSMRGEAELDRVAGARTSPKGVEFSRMKVEFTRTQGSSPSVKGCAGRRSAQPSTAISITIATTCACAAHSCRFTASTTSSDRSRSSGCSSAAPTKACSESLTKWWARRARRCCASIRFRRWRRACCASSSNSRTARRRMADPAPIPVPYCPSSILDPTIIRPASAERAFFFQAIA